MDERWSRGSGPSSCATKQTYIAGITSKRVGSCQCRWPAVSYPFVRFRNSKLAENTIQPRATEPTITTSRVNGTDDLWLVEVHIRQTNQRFASFQREVRPERRVPLVLFGVETGIQTVEPPVLERLDVDVEIRNGEVWFNPTELTAAYGRNVFGSPSLSPTPVVAPYHP